MKIAYIIGPYRAATIYGVHQNIQRAEKVGAILADSGAFPYIPHKNTAYLDGVANDDLWLDGNTEIIFRGIADFAVVLPEWTQSAGSLAEINLFKELELPVIYFGQPGFAINLRKILSGESINDQTI